MFIQRPFFVSSGTICISEKYSSKSANDLPCGGDNTAFTQSDGVPLVQ